jgi:hypothetical protein
MRNAGRATLTVFDRQQGNTLDANLDRYGEDDYLQASIAVSTAFAETTVLETPRSLRKTLLKYVIYHREKLVGELIEGRFLEDADRARSYVRESLYAVRRFVEPAEA